jgi:hypothetical protein
VRVGIILAAIFLLLSSSATILAFTSKDGSTQAGRVTTGDTAPAATDVEQPASQPPATAPDDNRCTTENESGPGYNRSVVRCKQEATSGPQSSSAPSAEPSAPQSQAAPPTQVEPATPAEPEPQPQAAPQQTNPGDADPACVTEEASGDGWNRTTVRCKRRSESAGSSTSSSSVMTSSSSVSVSN